MKGDSTRPPDPALIELREAYEPGNLVIFAGAGVSAAAGLPGWKKLVDLLSAHAQTLEVPPAQLQEIAELAASRQYINALSALKVCLGASEFCTFVERHLDDARAAEPSVARAIAALAPRLRAVLTTKKAACAVLTSRKTLFSELGLPREQLPGALASLALLELEDLDRSEVQEFVTHGRRLAFARGLARKLFASGATSATLNEVAELVLNVHGDRSLASIDEAVLEVQTAVFLAHDEERGGFQFAHKSFLEYFLAVDISTLLDDGKEAALELPRLTSEVVSFLSGMKGWERRKTQLRRILTTAYRQKVSENALLALYLAAREREEEGEALGNLLEDDLPARAQLAGAQLTQVDMPWVSLPEADLSGADLSGGEDMEWAPSPSPMLHTRSGSVQAVAWSPARRRLASGGEDGTVRVWDSLRLVAGASHGESSEEHGYAWGALRWNKGSWELGWAPRVFTRSEGIVADRNRYKLDDEGFAWEPLPRLKWSAPGPQVA